MLPLSLIVPTHNRPRELARALDSAASQDLQPAETLVVDDASDEAVTIDPQLAAQAKVRLIRHAENRGAAAARNTGLRAAETDWVTFLDSDDRLLPGSLAVRWAMVAEDQASRPDPKILYGCGWVEVREDGSPIAIRWPRASTSARDFASGCWFSPGSCLIFNRKAVLDAVGPQDEALRRYEDVDWFLALGRAGFVFKPLPVAAVVVERSRTLAPEKAEAAARQLLGKWRSTGLARPEMRRLESYMALEVAAANYHAGRPWRALRSLASSFASKPRLRLQLSPCWDVEPVSAVPEAPVYRRDSLKR